MKMNPQKIRSIQYNAASGTLDGLVNHLYPLYPPISPLATSGDPLKPLTQAVQTNWQEYTAYLGP